MRFVSFISLLLAFSTPGSGLGQGLNLPKVGGPKAKNPTTDGPKPTKFADVGTAKVEIVPREAKRGEAVVVKLTVTPNADTWTYPTKVDKGQVGKNVLPPKSGVLVFDEATDPAGSDFKNLEAGELDVVYKKAVTWELKAWVAKDAKPGDAKIEILSGPATVQICNKENCFNARDNDLPAVDFKVLDGEPVKLSAEDEKKYQTGLARYPEPKAEGKKTEEKSAAGFIRKKPIPPADHAERLQGLIAPGDAPEATREGGIAALLLTAAFWGLVSLATPCVFPMIPITVSLFLKQSNQSTGGAVKLAAVYCLTIVVVLGVAAVSVLGTFRALSVDPWMNLALGALFVVLALSLFGMFDIVLPNFLLRGAESRRKQGGLIGTVFGAIAFSIVSFTCVAPFLGGFAGMIDSQRYSWVEIGLAAVTFSSAFAAPFFILALFPRLLKALPKSGGWLDSVKVVMGFLEVAAALKFFRTAEIRWTSPTVLFTYDLVIAGWVVIAIACGLYLLNVYRLPHDEEKGHIGVPRLMFALLFLGFGLYLLPAMFKSGEENGRPRGVVFAWVDAFLLPEPGGAEFPWNSDLRDAVDRGRTDPEKGLVFVDFTGETCTNCKANEKNVFPKSAVRELLGKYQLASMYTDDVPAAFYTSAVPLADRKAEGKVNLQFQKDVFKTEQLPLYAVLKPTDTGAKVVAVYPGGLIGDSDVPAFVEFLSKPLAK